MYLGCLLNESHQNIINQHKKATSHHRGYIIQETTNCNQDPYIFFLGGLIPVFANWYKNYIYL